MFSWWLAGKGSKGEEFPRGHPQVTHCGTMSLGATLAPGWAASLKLYDFLHSSWGHTITTWVQIKQSFHTDTVSA